MELRLHILLPLIALVGMLLVVRGNVSSQMMAIALTVLVVSVALYELARVVTALRVGGHTDSIVLGPVGGWTRIDLPTDPPAHLATALAGPTTFFVLMVVAGCGLALGGDLHVLRLLNPIDPPIEWLPPPSIEALDSTSSVLPIVGQLVVWINCCLLLVSLMPIEPCAGADLLRSVLWPIVGRSTSSSLTSLVALGAAVFAVLLALVLRGGFSDGLVPVWFPLATAALFLAYGGTRSSHDRRYDSGPAIDEFDSDDEQWITGEWIEEDREAVLVEHLQDKQQEALDRKRRQREANEDARVDAILAQLQNISFEQLSDEDRAVLKRASQRYRRRGSDQHS